MTTRQPRILVGCDGSHESEIALSWAAEHARATDGQLTILSAWEWPDFHGELLYGQEFDAERDCTTLLEKLRPMVDLPNERVTTRAEHGNAARLLAEGSEEADLLVVGSHGMTALSRLLLGSVSAYAVTHAVCPVAVIRDTGAVERHGVLVGVDDSESARRALRWAMDYADLVGEPLTVLHVSEPPPPPVTHGGYAIGYTPPREVTQALRRWLRDLVAKEIANRGADVEKGIDVHIVRGHVGRVLVERSATVRLTVAGRRGAGGFRRLLLGSTAAALAHHVESPLVVTPT